MQNHTADMLALVNHGPRDYRLERIARPRPGARELLISVSACGICAGDDKCYAGAGMFWGGAEGGDPWVRTPVVPGHEFFGTVVEAGEGALAHFGVEIGERVTAEQIVPCGECRFCRSGSYWMCEVHNIFGFQNTVAEGAMAECMLFPPTARVYGIPDKLSFNDAATIEPLACAIHTVNRGDIGLDDVVVIAGAGPLGLFMVQIAHLKTPKKLIVIDPVDARLELARSYGADITINPAKENAEAVVRSLTGGYGCDVYIEATGNPVGVTQGLNMIRKLGRFVEFSVFGKETTADWSIIGDRKEITICGAHLSPYTYPVAIDLLGRGLATSEGIVTHRFSLSDWKAAFDCAHSVESIKVLLMPDGE
ncbi:MAG: alcohol dehydrogenase catalytic domain-containing protein [Candidatus Accumulibacter sp.]|jgi:L-iditol 2-dehydrogenase|nr:alcohol dehydrogenase catalytic domain-containing protein [Accumulibacter sp.]